MRRFHIAHNHGPTSRHLLQRPAAFADTRTVLKWAPIPCGPRSGRTAPCGQYRAAEPVSWDELTGNRHRLGDDHGLAKVVDIRPRARGQPRSPDGAVAAGVPLAVPGGYGVVLGGDSTFRGWLLRRWASAAGVARMWSAVCSSPPRPLSGSEPSSYASCAGWGARRMRDMSTSGGVRHGAREHSSVRAGTDRGDHEWCDWERGGSGRATRRTALGPSRPELSRWHLERGEGDGLARGRGRSRRARNPWRCPVVSAAAAASPNVQMNDDSSPPLPQNETAVAVSVADPLVAVAAANDYVSGGVVVMRTSDGGRSWLSTRITPQFTPTRDFCNGGDPSVAYSARDGAFYLAQLCFFRELPALGGPGLQVDRQRSDVERRAGQRRSLRRTSTTRRARKTTRSSTTRSTSRSTTTRPARTTAGST